MDEEIIHSKEFDLLLRDEIQILWVSEKFCDFTIIIEGKKFQVHKLVLAGASDYFKTMFEHKFNETSTNEITFNNLSIATMETILGFCYTAKLRLNEENFQDIVIAANFLQLKEIEQICANFLDKILSTNNCLRIYVMASRLKQKEIEEESFEFCLENFDKLVYLEEFLELEEEVLVQLISSDKLDVENEERVLKSLLKWISFDTKTRAARLEELIVHVRFAYIAPINMLLSLLSGDKFYKLINDSIKCRDLIDEAKDFLLLKDTENSGIDTAAIRFRKRLSNREKIERQLAAEQARSSHTKTCR